MASLRPALYVRPMAKITGLGGFFFKSSDPAATGKWMTDNLGLPMESWGQMFPWLEADTKKEGCTVLGLHSKTSDYFTGSTREFMLNLRVDDLDGMLAELAKKGITPVRTFPDEGNGKFAHVAGPDGITLELWQPS
jgi:predicted enzyme related to lactoylglutathione lyase